MDSSQLLSGGLVGAIGTVCTVLLGTVGIAFKSVAGVTKDLREQLAERNDQFVEMSKTISNLQFKIGELSTQVSQLERKCKAFESQVVSLQTNISKLQAENARLKLPHRDGDNETLGRW